MLKERHDKGKPKLRLDYKPKVTSLRALRIERGLSEERLAEELGTVRDTVRRWELLRSRPQPYWIRKLSNFYGVDCEPLVKQTRGSQNDEQDNDTRQG